MYIYKNNGSNFEESQKIIENGSKLTSGVVSANGNYIATGDEEGNVKLYSSNGQSYSKTQEFSQSSTGSRVSVTMSRDSGMLLVKTGKSIFVYQAQVFNCNISYCLSCRNTTHCSLCDERSSHFLNSAGTC